MPVAKQDRGQKEFTTKSTKNGARWVVECGNWLCNVTSGCVNRTGYYILQSQERDQAFRPLAPQVLFESFMVKVFCTSARV